MRMRDIKTLYEKEYSNIMSLTIIIAFIVLWVFLVPAILQWLWNITIPDIFKIRTISYWESFRLVIICAILFGGPYVNQNEIG